MDDQVQVEIESTDLTLGSVTSALVRVSDSDPFFILDRMENVIQSNRAVRIDSGDFKISDPLQTTEGPDTKYNACPCWNISPR